MPQLDVAINALRAKAGAKEFDSAVKKIQQGARDVDSSVKKTEASMGGFGASAKKMVGGLIGAAAAYKGLRIAISSVKEFAAFEMNLANVSTMLDETSMKYMPQYENQLKKMAIEFGEATGTLSKGLYDILSASVSADKAIGVLRISSKAAIAGLTDTGIAADALTTILNSYGLEAGEALKISDILFATVKAGKITFGELAAGIGKVSSLAAAVGLNFTEVSAAISTMTRSGVQSDIAMTALKGILTTFLSPQKENIVVAAKYGLTLNANTLRTIGLTGAIEKLKGATEEDIAAIFSNVRALTGIAAIRGNLIGFINDQEKATNSLGKTEEAYGKIAIKSGHQIKQAKEAWILLKREVGEHVIPIFLKLTETLLENIDTLTLFAKTTAETVLLPANLTTAIVNFTKDLKDYNEALERKINLERVLAGKKPLPKIEPSYGIPPLFIYNLIKAGKETDKFNEAWEGSYGVFKEIDGRITSINSTLYNHIPILNFYTRSLVDAGNATGRAAIGIEAFRKAGLPVPAILQELAYLEEDMAKASKKANKERLAGIKTFNEQTEAYQKAILGGEDYQEPILSEIDSAAIDELNELVLDHYNYEMYLLDKKVEAYQKAGADEYLIAKIKEAKIAELNKEEIERNKEIIRDKGKYLDDQAVAYRRLYDDLNTLGENSYANRIQLLDKERIKYAEFITDKSLLDEWYAERKRELDIERDIASDEFFTGFAVSIKQMEDNMITWGQVGASTAQTMKTAFGDAIASMIMDGATWKEAMHGFAMSMLRSFIDVITQMLTMKMIAMAFGVGGTPVGGGGAAEIGMSGGGWGFEALEAKGDIFNKGSVVPFAKGDILTRPTIFPMSNGGIGLGGEAGMEAIMPLKRDKSGRLGVRAEESRTTSIPIKIINVTDQSQVNEYLNSADGERQIVNIMRRNGGEIQTVIK